MKPKTLIEIAQIVQGELGDNKYSGIEINNIASSPETSTENDLVFVYEGKYFKDLQKIKAKAFIFPLKAKGKLPELSLPIIWTKRPRLVLKMLLEIFAKHKYYPEKGVHKTAVVDSSAKVSNSASVGAHVFIGPNSIIGENVIINPNVYVGSNVSIGNNSVIYSNVSIYDFVRIGKNVIIHSGTVIGSDGYSYATKEESNLEKAKKGNFNFNTGRQIQYKIPSVGSVIIEDDVEIGANSCVDSGTIGQTIIGAGTKIDNLVQVAHNCKIGKDCLIVAQVGLAGSVNIGDRVIAGGQAGFADNINIGSDVIFMAKCGVHGNIPSNSVYMGYPGVPYMDFIKGEKDKRRLPRKQEKLEEQVKLLEQKVKQLEDELSTKV